jgi:hypothetical protein
MTPRKEVPPIPPVPPNCPYFVNLIGDNGQPLPSFQGPFGICLHLANEIERPVIACVAAQYWDIESEAQTQRDEDVSRSKTAYRDACYEMAASWLSWGGLAPQKGDGA